MAQQKIQPNQVDTLNQNTTGTASNITGVYAGTITSSQVTTALGYTPGTGNGTVTAVSGTAPVVSSGGTTPAISMAKATGSVDGYLSSTDWTTFNNKGSGTVTAVSVASSNGFAGSSSGGATPSLTLSTSITGVLYGNGTSLAASNVTNDAQIKVSDYSAKGIVLVGTGSGTFAALSVGSNTQVLTADSTQASGVKWAAPAAATISWATYTGAQSAPTVTASSNVLALNFGGTVNSITESGTLYGSLYAGAGNTVSGASDRNIVLWGGTDTGGTSAVRTLTMSALKDVTIISPSDSANRTAFTQTTVVGSASRAGAAAATAIGYNNDASAANATGIGNGVTATGSGSLAVGYSAYTTNVSSTAIGYNAQVSAANSLSIGVQARSEWVGESAISGGAIGPSGVIRKSSIITLAVNTTNNTATELGRNNAVGGQGAPNAYMNLTTNSTYYMKAVVIGRNTTSAGNDYCQTAEFTISQDASAATTAIFGSVTYGTAMTRGTTTGWAFAITADTTNGRPAFKVTGATSTNISWVCRVDTVRVS